MAAYPSTIMQGKESKKTPIEVNKFSVASDGTVRGRTEASTDSFDFEIRHEHITTAEKEAIISHYQGHKNNTFNFTFDEDGTVYVNAYKGRPNETWMGEGIWNVLSRMVGA